MQGTMKDVEAGCFAREDVEYAGECVGCVGQDVRPDVGQDVGQEVGQDAGQDVRQDVGLDVG